MPNFPPNFRDKALRPVALIVAIAAHAAALAGATLAAPQLASPVESLEISIAPQQGDASPEAAQTESVDSIAQAQAAPQQKPDPEPPKEEKQAETPPPPEPEPVVAPPRQAVAEPPKHEVDDAEAIARRVAEQKKRIEERHRRLMAQNAPAQSAHHARAGVADGSRAPGLSRAAYGARMLAEIRHHQIHAYGSGSVRVAFAVGPSGHVVGASVISSSGDGALDATALRIVRSCHPGPPPGGSFSASATINFR